MNIDNREVSTVKPLWAAPERKQNTIFTFQAKCTLLNFLVYYTHVFSHPFMFLGSGILVYMFTGCVCPFIFLLIKG